MPKGHENGTGRVYPGEISQSDELSRIFYYDSRMYRKTDKSCGIIKYVAQLRFYCDKDLNWNTTRTGGPPAYPRPFKEPIVESGNLPAVKAPNKTIWWDTSPPTPVESINWTWWGKWECCHPPDWVSSSATGGYANIDDPYSNGGTNIPAAPPIDE